MLLLEEVGVQIQSELNIKDWEQKIGEKLTSGEFAEHKLTSITAGVTKTEIIDEKWTKKWNSLENECNRPSLKSNFCLPRAIKLTMAIKGTDERIISDSQVTNICIPPCNPEIFE